MDFNELAKSRHSAVNFKEGYEITDGELKEIFAIMNTVPSAFNLQSTEFLVIRDKEKKEKLSDIMYKQYKIKSSSAMIILLGNTKQLTELESAEKIYAPMKMLGMMNEEEYKMNMIGVGQYQQFISSDIGLLTAEMVVNAGISVMPLMLSAKEKGWDTCPMHVANTYEFRELLGIKEEYVPVMMIAIGKSVDKTRPRGYRRRFTELVHIEKM